MGTLKVRLAVVAESAEQAWREIVAEAIEKYGNDSCNGTFSTCSFIRITKKFEGKVTKSNLVAARKMVDELFDDYKVDMRLAYAIDCGIDHYALVSVKKIKAAGRPKQKFVVVWSIGEREWEKAFPSLDEAQDEATKIVLEDASVERVYVQKRSVYEGNNMSAFTYMRVTKVLKSKPKRIPKGARLVEYHKYYFYGLAVD